MPTLTTTPSAKPDFFDLVLAVTEGDESKEGDLLACLTPGLRCLLRRKLAANDVDDAVQEVLIAVLHNLRSGQLRDSTMILGYVRTIATRYVYQQYRSYGRDRRNEVIDSCGNIATDAEPVDETIAAAERKALAVRALQNLRPLQREILHRFYMAGESKEQILASTGMTETQFRLAKTRAKAALADHLNRRRLPAAIINRLQPAGGIAKASGSASHAVAAA